MADNLRGSKISRLGRVVLYIVAGRCECAAVSVGGQWKWKQTYSSAAGGGRGGSLNQADNQIHCRREQEGTERAELKRLAGSAE